DRVEDLAAALVGDGRTAGVDRVAHPQVLGDETVVEQMLGRLGERREAQAPGREPVGPVRAGPARGPVGRPAPPRPLPAPRRVRANAADTSSSSSRPSTRVTPNWRNTADVIASEPVRWPVWLWAIDAPSSVRPTFTITIGLPSCAAWSAASISVRPSLKPSM